MKVRATDKQISEIIASNYYIIPRFQRPYSWDSDNITEFWNDTVVDTKLDDDYFIGSIVVYQAGNFKGIVDGQQRMTTIIILLCALRDVFREQNLLDFSEGVQNLIERTNIDNKKQFVLSTESSFPFFQEKILKSPKSDISTDIGPEEQNIYTAYSLFKSKFDQIVSSFLTNPSLSEEIKADKIKQSLVDIRKKVLDLKIILVELDNEDEAYLIFETLNTRGKELTVTDLLRNFIAKNLHADNSDSDTAKLKWMQILSNINGSPVEIDTDTFFLHQWISKYSFVSGRLLFKEIKKTIKGEEVGNYLSGLVSDSEHYRTIYDVRKREWKQEELAIVSSLLSYQVFNVKQHMPVILAALRSYDRKDIKLKQLLKIIEALEKFHFLYTAITSSRSTGGMAQMYSNFAIKLEKEHNSQIIAEIVKEFIEKLKVKVPSFEEFNIKFKEFTYTESNTKNKNLVRYILTKYDRHLRKSTMIDYKNMSIEHIYSQNATIALEENTIGQIGNLFLVDYAFNSEKLKSKSFTEKKKLLMENNYPLDKIINDSTTFGKEQIESRTNSISEVAYNRIWKM